MSFCLLFDSLKRVNVLFLVSVNRQSVVLDIKCCYHWFVTIFKIKDILHQDAQSNATPCGTVTMQWFVHFLSLCFSYLERVQGSHQELNPHSVKQKRSCVYSQMLQYNLKTAVAWIIKIYWHYVLCSSLNTYVFVCVCSCTGIPSEGDAGNSFPSYLAGWVYSRPRHWFLAH